MYASSRRRRRRKTPFILLGSVLLFGVVAAVLLTSKGDTSNASVGEMEHRTTTAAPPPLVPRVSPSPPPEPTTNMVTPDATRTADEMLFGSGAGDGTHVRWSKYRFYFVNKCSHPLNIFQKYRDDAPKWAFCQVPVESYGCPNNRDGAYLHTLDGGQDQAT
ncbi:hypothetical protein B5M09_013954 [Aphanomyces astaci]|nr:hypothetical protein B5M09_013954 [Aphanomyces astaci]